MEDKKERQLYECKRCGHRWFSNLHPPKVCARCHSPYWDTEKLNHTGGVAEKVVQ